jgi:hypothetical protein
MGGLVSIQITEPYGESDRVASVAANREIVAFVSGTREATSGLISITTRIPWIEVIAFGTVSRCTKGEGNGFVFPINCAPPASDFSTT